MEQFLGYPNYPLIIIKCPPNLFLFCTFFQNGKFDVEGGEQFETLSELLEYYMKNTMVDTSDRSIHLIYFVSQQFVLLCEALIIV